MDFEPGTVTADFKKDGSGRILLSEGIWSFTWSYLSEDESGLIFYTLINDNGEEMIACTSADKTNLDYYNVLYISFYPDEPERYILRFEEAS